MPRNNFDPGPDPFSRFSYYYESYSRMMSGEDGCTCYDETTRRCPVHTKPWVEQLNKDLATPRSHGVSQSYQDQRLANSVTLPKVTDMKFEEMVSHKKTVHEVLRDTREALQMATEVIRTQRRVDGWVPGEAHGDSKCIEACDKVLAVKPDDYLTGTEFEESIGYQRSTVTWDILSPKQIVSASKASISQKELDQVLDTITRANGNFIFSRNNSQTNWNSYAADQFVRYARQLVIRLIHMLGEKDAQHKAMNSYGSELKSSKPVPGLPVSNLEDDRE